MAMMGLSFGVFAAFGLQWRVTSRPVAKWVRGAIGWREWFRPALFSSEVKVFLRAISLGVIGIGAAQINSAVDAIFARIADPSGPAYLWYAIRVQQLPLALFGIAIAGALLPPLSRAMQGGDLARYRDLMQKGLRQSASLMIPCTFAMIVLAESGLDLLYGHGDFMARDVAATGLCLQAYALGLTPMVYTLLLANGFYAQKKYGWPMRCSLVSVGCNALLNTIFVLVFHWGAVSIAIATSASAFVNCTMLSRGLAKGIGQVSLWWGEWRLAIISLIAAAAATGADWVAPHQHGFISQMSRFFMSAGAFGAVLTLLAYLFDVREIFAWMKWKKASPETGEA
jgi:putative peptidoglycan lipid II flippase